MQEKVKEFQGSHNLISSEPLTLISYTCKFRWSIANFPLCGLRDHEHLTSPEFKTCQSSPTTWRLQLYPCELNRTGETVGLYLERSSKDLITHYAYYKLSIIGSNRMKYNTNEDYSCFERPLLRKSHGYPNFINRKELFREKDLFLPKNTLTILCELTYIEMEDYKTSNLKIPLKLRTLSFEPSSSSSVVFKKPDSLICDLQQLYNSKMLSDFTLKVGDEEFKAHKNILCARSSVFNTMLNCEMEEKLTNCVKITDFDSSTVGKMLHYIYCGQVEDLTPDVALQLYSAAEKYDLQDLKDICAEYLSNNISVDNFCDVLILAKLHNREGLMEAAGNFFKMNTAAIKKNEKWLSLSKTNPYLVIAMYEAIV